MTVFDEIVESQTAGSPMHEKVRWTNLKDFRDSQIIWSERIANESFYRQTVDQNERLGEAQNEQNDDD